MLTSTLNVLVANKRRAAVAVHALVHSTFPAKLGAAVTVALQTLAEIVAADVALGQVVKVKLVETTGGAVFLDGLVVAIVGMLVDGDMLVGMEDTGLTDDGLVDLMGDLLADVGVLVGMRVGEELGEEVGEKVSPYLVGALLVGVELGVKEEGAMLDGLKDLTVGMEVGILVGTLVG